MFEILTLPVYWFWDEFLVLILRLSIFHMYMCSKFLKKKMNKPKGRYVGKKMGSKSLVA